MQRATGLGILGCIQLAFKWDNDPVWRNYSHQGRERRGVSGYPPPGGHLVAVGNRRSGEKNNIYVTISDGA